MLCLFIPKDLLFPNSDQVYQLRYYNNIWPVHASCRKSQKCWGLVEVLHLSNKTFIGAVLQYTELKLMFKKTPKKNTSHLFKQGLLMAQIKTISF